jgi:hypothetical protein
LASYTDMNGVVSLAFLSRSWRWISDNIIVLSSSVLF